jgi:hypothetical protein
MSPDDHCFLRIRPRRQGQRLTTRRAATASSIAMYVASVVRGCADTLRSHLTCIHCFAAECCHALALWQSLRRPPLSECLSVTYLKICRSFFSTRTHQMASAARVALVASARTSRRSLTSSSRRMVMVVDTVNLKCLRYCTSYYARCEGASQSSAFGGSVSNPRPAPTP